MKCPHCRNAFHEARTVLNLKHDRDGQWLIFQNTCPTCHKFVLQLVNRKETEPGINSDSVRFIHPKASSRPPVPNQVPDNIASAYSEACFVLEDSPKASAALSRRCLQHIIWEKTGIKKRNLDQEIQALLDQGGLPSHLAESIDAVRWTGNFAAHPIKGESTGEIVDVEPGEAEWNLDTLEALFDFYFVQPEIIAQKRKALEWFSKEISSWSMFFDSVARGQRPS